MSDHHKNASNQQQSARQDSSDTNIRLSPSQVYVFFATGSREHDAHHELVLLCNVSYLQENVLQAVLRGVSLFFTGKAGSGKSFLLSHLIKALRDTHGVRHDDACLIFCLNRGCNIFLRVQALDRLEHACKYNAQPLAVYTFLCFLEILQEDMHGKSHITILTHGMNNSAEQVRFLYCDNRRECCGDRRADSPFLCR
jgi:hypothetical protein